MNLLRRSRKFWIISLIALPMMYFYLLPNAFYFTAWVLLRVMGKYDAGCEVLELLPKVVPTQFSKKIVLKGYERIGYLLYRVDSEVSLKAYRRARDMGSTEYVNMSATFSDTGRYKEAIEACLQAIKIDSQNATAYCNIAGAFLEMGKYEEAIKMYNYNTALYSPSAHRGICEAYADLKQYDKAIDCYDAVNKKYDGTDRIAKYSKCIVIAVKQKKYKEGLACFADLEQEIFLSSLEEWRLALSTYKYWQVLAEIVGDQEQAEVAHQKRLDLAQRIYDIETSTPALHWPYNHAVYCSIGRMYYELERYEEALAAFDQAIKIKSSYYAIPYEEKGIVYMELGRYEEALAAFDQACAADPEDLAMKYRTGKIVDEMMCLYQERDRRRKLQYRPEN